MVLNQSFQNFLNNCAKEQTDRTRFKVLERRGQLFNTNTRSGSMPDDLDSNSNSSILAIYHMRENEKIWALNNVIDILESRFVYNSTITN